MNKPMRVCLRGMNILLLTVCTAFLLYQIWLCAWVLYWKWFDPQETSFMAIRLRELQIKQPGATLKQQWVPYAHISPQLKQALIASEDAKFLEHRGFDWEGIQSALRRNEHKGRLVAGGSTISQQLAKNLFLSPARSFWRKGQEALITVMIESLWDKLRILEVYMNVIEWGNGVFGAEAAAQHYYGVHAQQLTALQAARLAAMVPAPRFHDRNRHSAMLERRAATIRARMSSAIPP